MLLEVKSLLYLLHICILVYLYFCVKQCGINVVQNTVKTYFIVNFICIYILLWGIYINGWKDKTTVQCSTLSIWLNFSTMYHLDFNMKE